MPRHTITWAMLFKDQGDLEKAVTCYRRALELKPDYSEAHSNLLFAIECSGDTSPNGLKQAYAEYELRHAAPLKSTCDPMPMYGT